jgi:short-subunit dehydrogenase
LAKSFASEGLHVFVAGRTQSRLDALTVEIEQAGVKRLQSVQTLRTKSR